MNDRPTRNDVLKRDDWRGTNLDGLSLGNLDLSGRDFRDCDLRNVQFGNTNLSGADFRGAKLGGANLGAANLTGANLFGCDLRETNLQGAVLLGADTRGCLGLSQPFAVHSQDLFRHVQLEETESCKAARADGYLPIVEWAKVYRHREDGETLFSHRELWQVFRDQFGELIFGDKSIFEQVRLVQQYVNYGRWTYLISRAGFEQLLDKVEIRSALEPIPDNQA